MSSDSDESKPSRLRSKTPDISHFTSSSFLFVISFNILITIFHRYINYILIKLRKVLCTFGTQNFLNFDVFLKVFYRSINHIIVISIIGWSEVH